MLNVKCGYLEKFDIAENVPTHEYFVDKLMRNPKYGILITDEISNIMRQSATMLSVLYNRFGIKVSQNFLILYLNHVFSIRPRSLETFYNMWIRSKLIHGPEVDKIDADTSRVLFADYYINNINHENYIISIIHYALNNIKYNCMVTESFDVMNSIINGLFGDKQNTDLLVVIYCLLLEFNNNKNESADDSLKNSLERVATIKNSILYQLQSSL